MKQFKDLMIFFLTTIICLQVNAKIVIKESIKAESGIPEWMEQFGTIVKEIKSSQQMPKEGYTECRETTEIEGAFLCLSDTQVNMNTFLGRASAYIEGVGGKKGQVSKLNDGNLLRFRRLIGGHDLKGSDLMGFHNAVVNKCETEKTELICFNSSENEIFNDLILPMTSARKNFVVITFARESGMDWREVVTHEILHAQYFNDENFRKITDEFWENTVSAEDKKIIVSILGRHYDAGDELLMRNEFQAYILMAGAEFNQLASFVGKYRESMILELQKSGIKPVQVLDKE